MPDQISPEYSDAVLKDFCDEIVKCMVLYAGWEETRARQRLESSRTCDPDRLSTDSSRALLFHQYPYYYAMELVHGRENQQWFNDPELGLWPPPPEAEDYWENYKYPHER